MSKKVSTFGIFVWSIAILYFFYEFFLRIFLGTVATDVIRDLNLTIEQFSIVGSAYYITYGIMQLPVGILADRYGPRKILTIACLICTIGVFGLSVSHTFYAAIISRLLIGFGSAFAFVCLLVLALNWFPRKHFAPLCGLAQFLGAIGPIMAGGPLAMLNESLDGNWRLILFWIGLFGVGLMVLILLFLRNKPAGKENEIIFLSPRVPLSKKIKQLLRIPQVWWILMYSGTLYVSMPLLGAYWGTTYLTTRGFSNSEAASIVSMIWIGFAAGAPLVGKVSEIMKRRKPMLIITALCGVFSSAMILYLPITNTYFLIALFMVLGFSAAGQSLAFPTISEHVPEKLHSPALGMNNSAITGFAAILPPIASSIIQSADKGHSASGLTIKAFTEGLSMMPLCFTVAFLIAFLFIRETFCHQQLAVHKINIAD